MIFNLSTSQLQSIKNWVVANHNSVFDNTTVDVLNTISTPDYYVLKSDLAVDEIMTNGFDWTRVDNASAGQARIWDWMCGLFAKTIGSSKRVNPSNLQFLRGVGEAWKGNSPTAQTDHRRAILVHTRRKVRVWEKLFVAATADWNVATNGDQTGNRGVTTNPDTLGKDLDGKYLDGDIDLEIVVASANS